jgi:hypothetical protein
MVEIDKRGCVDLIDAILCWTGWGDSATPSRDDARLMARFGWQRGSDLLREIKSLENDFYLSDAYLLAADIQDMAKRCAEDFKLKRPDIAEEIINALVWCYTFDYK